MQQNIQIRQCVSTFFSILVPVFGNPSGSLGHVTLEFFSLNRVSIFRSTELRVVPIDVAARVWMLLPGRKASVFRKNLAELFIRVLGGDARLADEIKEIGEFQDTLPADHPLRAFRDAVKQDNQVERAALAPDMQAVIKSVKEQFHQQFRDAEGGGHGAHHT